MEILQTRILRGPNIWTQINVLEITLTCDEQSYKLSSDFKNTFQSHYASFYSEVVENKNINHAEKLLEQLLLYIQIKIGCPVSFSQTKPLSEKGSYKVIVAYSEEAVGKQALLMSTQLIEAIKHNKVYPLEKELITLKKLYENIKLGPSTGAIAEAAIQKGIPYKRLTTGSLVQLGFGCYQRHFQAAEIDSTSAVAATIAQDKDLTKTLLANAGIPVPKGYVTTTLEETLDISQHTGFPLVVKPLGGNQGLGVFTNIQNQNELIEAVTNAQQFGKDIVLERYISGKDFRLFVVEDKLVAAAERKAPYVIGDGIHSITALVKQINTDPCRGESHNNVLTKIPLNAETSFYLAKQGLDFNSIPLKDELIILRSNANLSTGGTATDLTDTVHPQFVELAVKTAKIIGLNICGIDLICEDLSKPVSAQHDIAIIEVNACPGLRMHIRPSFGKNQPVGDAIVNAMFQNHNGRIPLISVTGTNGKTTTVRLISHVLSAFGKTVGMTNTEGVYINNQRIKKGDCSGPISARGVLMHPEVDTAVFELARGGILREGLPYDYSDVGVVTNIGNADHLGLNDIHSPEEIASVKQVVVKNISPNGTAVLNADDPLVVKMASSCPCKIIYFSTSEDNPLLQDHIQTGGRAIYLTKETIVCVEMQKQISFLLKQFPITGSGTLAFQSANLIAAFGATWALGFGLNDIASHLASFENSIDTLPGRFNLFKYQGATIIADYGHNIDAITAIINAIEKYPAKRRWVVTGSAGDRKNEVILEQATLLGQAFDKAILYQDDCQRGRADGEISALLRQGFNKANRINTIEEIDKERDAIDHTLNQLSKNDLCVIFIDDIDNSLKHIQKRCQLDEKSQLHQTESLV